MADDGTNRPVVSIIAAVAETGVIGRGGELPWRLPADLKHFKSLTTDKTIIMGRRTFESIGRPLPKRRSIVVTRQSHYAQPGAETATSLNAALNQCAGEDEVFIIGGRSIYDHAFHHADRLYLTRVHGQIEGDVYCPDWSSAPWALIEQSTHPADDEHAYAMTFETYHRQSP